MIRHDAPAELLERAEAILAKLDQYPVYDESDWSSLEYEEACAYWETMNVRERAQMIRDTRCGASIFAARRAELPQDDTGALMESLRG